MGNKLEINSGDRYGRLTIIEERAALKKTRMFLCRCDCGEERVFRLVHLRSGHTTSCGCFHREKLQSIPSKLNLPFGYSAVRDRSQPEFKIYLGILNRCYNPKHISWERYGGRGITVDSSWIKEKGAGFYQFMEDMGPRPYKHNIDRIDPNKGYSKENCRWVSASVSSFNCGVSCKNTSGVPGVSWKKNANKWCARIGKNYKRINLGCFDSFEDAVAARKAAELLYFGEYCPC